MIQKLERNSRWKDHTRSNKQQKAPSAASIYNKKQDSTEKSTPIQRKRSMFSFKANNTDSE